MFKAVEERDYPDYDYLDDEEAIYQGYDAEGDSDYSVGFTVYEPEQKTETREDPEKNNGDKESRDSEADENRDSEVDESTDDDDIWLDGDEDINENEEPDDQLMIDDSEADADEEAWYEDEESESGEKVSPESYVIDGNEYKDPRKYIQALYQRDARQYSQLKPEKQIELAHAVRRGMLCDCSIMPEDPVVPDEYPYKLVDKTSKVLKRLDQTEEEKAWVVSLSLEEKKEYIKKGRTAQEQMISHNLPLVMSIAGEKYKTLEYMDRVQAGNMGLLKAVQYFKDTLNSDIPIGSEYDLNFLHMLSKLDQEYTQYIQKKIVTDNSALVAVISYCTEHGKYASHTTGKTWKMNMERLSAFIAPDDAYDRMGAFSKATEFATLSEEKRMDVIAFLLYKKHGIKNDDTFDFVTEEPIRKEMGSRMNP